MILSSTTKYQVEHFQTHFKWLIYDDEARVILYLIPKDPLVVYLGWL